MTKKLAVLFLFSVFLTKSYSQVTKGNWLAGGNFSYQKDKSRGADAIASNSRTIAVSPDIGYFVFDKFASGLRLDLTFTKKNIFRPMERLTPFPRTFLALGLSSAITS